MAKKNAEKTALNKENWQSSFNLVGEARVNDNTFQLDQQSQKSDWVYNRFNIGLDCGEESGVVYAQAMGGYGANRDNVIYVHGKDENDKDDWQNQYTIDWEDRNDESILSDIGDACFYTAAIETDTKGKLVYMRFLSQYDMIQYLSEHLEDGMALSISGNLSYQEYEGSVNVQKDIRRVTLISDPKPENYHATFTQSVLIDQDSKGDVDKEKGTIYIDAYILEYFKEYNGVSLANGKAKGGLVPLKKTFEYKINLENKELTQKAIKKLFVPKAGTVSQITFNGEFVESGATVQATVDDLPDEIKDLIALGIYSEEEALAQCATNGNRERRMVFTAPFIKKVTDNDGNVTPVVQIFDAKYTDDDLLLDCIVNPQTEFEDADEDEIPEDFKDDVEDTDDNDEDDWLSQL